MRDPLIWLQEFTCTKDPHWKEVGAASPYRPFPKKEYFRPIVDAFQKYPILALEKSRDLMISWIIMGLFSHLSQTIEAVETLVQSQKESKSFALVEYAKTLYENQPGWLKDAYPLRRNIDKMPAEKMEYGNGSTIIGIPHGADQIRSYHPTHLFSDESAFQPDAGESYDHAISACQKIVLVSSQGPSWYAEFVENKE